LQTPLLTIQISTVEPFFEDKENNNKLSSLAASEAEEKRN
jgi:hypothetical protein